MKVRIMVTKCDRCGKTWNNTDNRDYSGDNCPSCGQRVTVVGWKEKEISDGPLQITTNEMKLNIE